MKKYVIDELAPSDHSKLKKSLADYLHPSGLEGIFWLFIEDDLLNQIQSEHTDCRPFYLAIELTETALNCELLVRATQRLRCDCLAYADEKQRNWAVNRIEEIVAGLAILT